MTIKTNTIINNESIKRTLQVLIDNGVEEDEAEIVLQAIGYTLLNTELFPEDNKKSKIQTNEIYHMSEYEKYKLQWMIDHNHSISSLITELKNMQYDDPEDSDRISTPIDELFNEFENDRGFGGEIWSCEKEYEIWG